MIKFKNITMKNFMSVGNSPLTIDYTNSPSTIVVASNGVGKSSVLLDSISFALYGRPYRNINKPQLLNSINQKNLLVEISFSVNKDEYIVRRGIKPAVFEIVKNKKTLNQTADSKDYQKILEQNILKMNFRTFTQVVIMGSASYTPFMKLTPNLRREFIEDVLDIKIFSTMNLLLKQQIKSHQEKLVSVSEKVNVLKEKALMQKEFIGTLNSQKETRLHSIEEDIKNIQSDIDKTMADISEWTSECDTVRASIKDHSTILGKKQELNSIGVQMRTTMSKYEKDKKLYTTTEKCPTCHQDITSDHRGHLVSKVDSKMAEFEKGMGELATRLENIDARLKQISESQDKISELQSKVNDGNSAISISNRMIAKHQKELTDIKTQTGSSDVEEKKLEAIKHDLSTLMHTKKSLSVEEQYNSAIAVMLKDSGIKTRIIKQYIPLFNQLINKFLNILELFVDFQIDENFSETVKSRYRDTFTYDSFSEGEKQRIDLALLFVFREVARMKNALNCNLLILDEVLDHSLDSVGIDSFFSIIGGLKSTNLFVISHRSDMQDKFDSTLRLVKKGNFTTTEEVA